DGRAVAHDAELDLAAAQRVDNLNSTGVLLPRDRQSAGAERGVERAVSLHEREHSQALKPDTEGPRRHGLLGPSSRVGLEVAMLDQPRANDVAAHPEQSRGLQLVTTRMFEPDRQQCRFDARVQVDWNL